ncbi:MAG: DUF1704 domain-containing protein [Candidatus Moranbacteria bacterium]|nr:DUF1704 domain-containing protein [Candidatus Moranbacteria bacterium]MDD3964611.1 DUF1704 domain-containing protein [Candidatus Moranbacteria bacterium]
MFENPAEVKPKPKEEALDTQWYSQFEKIGSFQAYEYFDGDKQTREREKQTFLAGEKENPELDYPLLNLENIASREGDLLRLKELILNEEENEVVKQVYWWKLNEKIAENRLLKAAATGDQRKFKRYSEFIYGKPSPEIFAYSLGRVRQIMKKADESENEEIRVLGSEFASLFSIKDAFSVTIPSREVQAVARESTLESVGDLVNINVDSDQEFSAEEIKVLFEGALQELSSEGWIVVINPNKSGISVNQEKKSVEIPENKKLSLRALKGLIAHEIGTHAARRIRGERTKLKMLGLGFDRYEAGEEGITGLREQVLEGEVKDFSGFDGHFAISLATGVDGHPRDFRQTFEILKKYYHLQNMLKGMPREESEKKAETSAWGRCVRTFRGTNSQTPGICFTKDIIYREGNIAIWESVAKNTPEMSRWDVGKYDPSNPRHIWILDQLNITDEQLQSLEK